MPLDGHDFLVSQGWSGRGTGLRQGAISRPIAIPQKRNLAGLGKDRDEAFPFWDHLFTAASKTIKLKLASDDESDQESSPLPEIRLTTTGIMSNRRPTTGASATTSGTSTPDVGDGNACLTLIAIAKRDAARASLYARFFRGPILGPDDVFPAPLVEQLPDDGQTNSAKTNDKKRSDDVEGVEYSIKKRKRDSDDAIARAQRKKARKEQKTKEKEERRARRRERRENDDTANKVASEDAEKKEKKRRKPKSREEEKSEGSESTDQVTKEKGKEGGKKKEKSRKSRKDDITGAADVPCEVTVFGSGELFGMLDPDVSAATSTDQQRHEARERKRKKRRREEA